jgi:acyl-CoA synthetase (AMP-forming)/AMP-acid ligase II
MPFPEYTPTAPVFIRHLAETFGDREMIVLDDERLTYRQAEERSRELAKGMLASGIGKGTRVGILMPNGPEFVVTFLAAVRIGAIVIPFNTFYKPKELGYVLHHADIEVFLAVPTFLNNDYVERLEKCAPGLTNPVDASTADLFIRDYPYLRAVYLWGMEPADKPHWARDDESFYRNARENVHVDDSYLEAVEAAVTPADQMIIIYSSGSTSDPKGAIHSHGAVVRHGFNLNTRRDLLEDDRVFSPMPFFWVGGLVFTLVCIMHKGACLVCEDAFNPPKTLELLEKEKVTIVTGWPHYGKALTDHPDSKTRNLSSIRAGNIYEILPEEVRPKDPELRSNGLGMTETCSPHSLDMMDTDLPEEPRSSYGRALEGLEHKIINPETGEALPAGEFGELLVRGYSVMQGLYKIEREEVFDADGYYHTEDGCHLNEDGVLFFKGRIGDMIKTGGANVTPREVEIAIDEQPEVQVSFVVGLPDPDRGQNVAAAIVLNGGAELDADTLRARLKEDLSSYKVPKYFFFKNKNDLPFTDSGKINKKLLTEQLAKDTA